MITVEFTSSLSHQTNAPRSSVDGATVRECLQAVFEMHPALRGYVMDDQNAVRQHVVVFLNGTAISDRRMQSDPVKPDSEIFVMQALSGG
ncbi:MAG: MoaD/ThiS family protein [Verrucomicrobiota bacterium]